MIKVTFPAGQHGVRQLADRLRAGLTPQAINHVVEGVAFRTLAHVVEKTPKKWFGHLRQAWQVKKVRDAVYSIRNGSVVMTFLELGTANQGTGYIYPTQKRVLYIPLNRNAAMGWKPSLKRGVDYILRVRVKGIRPRYIVRDARAKAGEDLKASASAHVNSILSAT